MNVSMCMTREPVTIGPELPLTEAAALMAQKKIRRLLVVEPSPGGVHLLGIVTANDILHAYPPEVNPFAVIVPPNTQQAALTAGKFMHRQLHITSPEAPIEEAAALMRDQKIGSLPVLRDQQLVGLITESDIFRAFVGLFETQGTGARITFDVSTGEDVFGLVARLSQKYGLQVNSLIRGVQDNQPICVTRVSGKRVDGFLEEIWNSGHRVMNVIRFSPSPDGK